MKEYFKYIPLLLLIAFSLKLLINGASFQDATILAVLATYSAYIVDKEDRKQFLELKNKIETLEKQLEKTTNNTEDLRSYVSTLKLTQQIKTVAKF